MTRAFYRRRLPHWHPRGKALFITWRLSGSLPAGRAFPKLGEDTFATFDRLLDQMTTGPLFLRIPEIASIVAAEIQRVNEVTIAAWVIMPNHVHLLAEPLAHQSVDWPKYLGTIKGRSARQANILLERTGQPFWQDESYDHWIRDDDEFTRTRSYILENPVTAGLASTADNFRWSSAWSAAQSEWRT